MPDTLPLFGVQDVARHFLDTPPTGFAENEFYMISLPQLASRHRTLPERYRQDHFEFYWTQRGQAWHRTDHLCADQLHVSLPGQVKGWSHCAGQGFLVLCSPAFLVSTLANQQLLRQLGALSEQGSPLFTLTDGQAREFNDSLHSLYTEYTEPRRYTSDLLRFTLLRLLLLVDRWFGTQSSSPSWPSATERLVRQFQTQVAAHFAEGLREGYVPMRYVSDYAEMLHVHPTYLSNTMKEAIGKPASHVIREQLIRVAQDQLRYTTLNVTEVAYLLGFDNSSYFARFFKRHTGASPRHYREEAVLSFELSVQGNALSR